MLVVRVGGCVVLCALLTAFVWIGVGHSAPQRPPAPALGTHPLIANMHGLLFHDSTNDLQEDVSYAHWLGAGAIRAFATDNNSVRPWSGQQVGTQVVRLAPMLRSAGVKLIVALVNNHRAVPGEASNASGLLDNYQQLLLPFFTTTWRNQYLSFVRDLIGTVRNAGALDVVGAWELGNELHTPEDPKALIPFVTGAAAEVRAVDPSTPIFAGTMGANHVEPGTPTSPIARWLYCDAPVDAYTLHAYDWVSPDRQGDMPIYWDLDNIVSQPCPSGRALPVIVEELGTSRGLAGAYQADDEATRVVYELRQIRRVLHYPQVVGVGVWNAESPRVVDTTFLDSRRGLTSYGAHALGGGSCYDPRPDPAPGARCEYEQVLRQLSDLWPGTAPAAWLPGDSSTPTTPGVVGFVDPPVGPGPARVSGWVVDTAHTDGPGINGVDVYLGTPGQGGVLLASGQLSSPRPEIETMLGDPDWVNAGFQMDIPQDGLPNGIANLTLVARTAEGTAWTTTLGTIVPASAFVPPPPLPAAIVAAAPPVTVADLLAPPRLQITSPGAGATISNGQLLQALASDPVATVGSGIDRVDIFMEPGRDAGGRLLGTATQDRVGAAAFSLTLRLARGPHTLDIHAHSSVSGRETVLTLPIKVS
jgi:hypothetical protein